MAPLWTLAPRAGHPFTPPFPAYTSEKTTYPALGPVRTALIAATLFFVAAPALAQLSDFERSRRNTAAYFN
jgi:hypothetical protein